MVSQLFKRAPLFYEAGHFIAGFNNSTPMAAILSHVFPSTSLLILFSHFRPGLQNDGETVYKLD
jgi:hypothetical protein